jgi:NADPH:quinone reductase-like Zn-dependent oxidoreductase
LIGTRVAFLKAAETGVYKYGGTYAEYCVTDAQNCLPLPDEISFNEAASIMINPVSAVCMVDRIRSLKSKCVIITAACSQIGKMLINLCHLYEIKPICIVRRDEQVKILKDNLSC